MGTRADFYVGRGPDAEWIGSVAFDGYPEGVGHKEYPHGQAALAARDEKTWRQEIAELLAGRDDATTPEQGWPWPWDNSQTTDYAYAFDEGKVWVANFGHGWYDAAADIDAEEDMPLVEFPNMSERKNVTLGKRGGITILTKKGE